VFFSSLFSRHKLNFFFFFLPFKLVLYLSFVKKCSISKWIMVERTAKYRGDMFPVHFSYMSC
jgi:hypothetical protein